MRTLRSGLLLAVIAAILIPVVASAQPVVCSAVAQPLTVRAEGYSELTGDVVIVCTGGTTSGVGTALPQTNISVTLNTNISSRFVADPLTEALLFIDDPQPSAQSPCTGAGGLCAPLTAGIGGTAVDSGGVVRNVFQGVRQNDNTMAFLGIPFNAPGASASRVIRIKNLRAAVAGASIPAGQIFALISIQSSTLQLNNTSVNVAFVQQGVEVSLRSRTGGDLQVNSTPGTALFQCQNWNSDLVALPNAHYSGANSSAGGRNLEIRFKEAFAAAFKVRDVNPPLTEPGQQQNVPQNNNGSPQLFAVDLESGFYNTGFPATNGLNKVGRANHGTRLRAGFSMVPANVRVYVSVHALSTATLAIDTTNRQSGGGETSSAVAAYGVSTLGFGQNADVATVLATPTSDTEMGLGGAVASYPVGAAAGLIEVPIANGSGSFTWEIFAQSSFQVDTVSFAVSFGYRTVDNPGTGTVAVNGSFAPVGGPGTMSATAPLPRFADQSVAMNGAQLSSCDVGCSFQLSTGSATFANSGGTGSVNVTASAPACIWTAVSGAAWVTVTSAVGGTGNGTVSYTVQANPTGVPRSTTIVIGGQTLAITQGCSFTLSGSSATIGAGGATASVDVLTEPLCVWTATTNTTWLTITSNATNTGNARVTFTAIANTGTARSGTLTLAGQTFSVSQDGLITASPLRFVPLAPCRLMETRPEYNFQGRTGAFGPPFLTRGETRVLNVPQSNVCQVPATAKAYVLNVTLVPRSGGVDFVTVWPSDEARPNVWTVRSPDGQIVANSAIVKAGANGAISVYSSDVTDLIIDISGYFTDNPGQVGYTYYSVSPCRVVDTRSQYRTPAGPFGPPTMVGGERRSFQLPAATQYCQVPQGAKAYAVTITVAPPGPLQFLTAWPTGGSQPNVSNLNSPAGRTLANSVIVPASANGSIDLFVFDRSDVLIDITGYFGDDNGQGLYYFPVTQCRVDDSQFIDEQAKTLGVPTAFGCTGIPASAKAYAATVTSISSGASMPFLTLYPTGQLRPNASTLNAFEGQTVTNSTIVPSGTGGSIDVFAYRRTRVVLDVSGYFNR